MELISDYMLEDDKRHMLNELTQKTFGFDFEGWVTGGYYEGDYIPYSFVEDGKMLSNVSANRMRFLMDGIEKEYIQIGTVMTDEAYRRRGFAGKLMKCVIKEYEGKCDGIYLFADLKALDFYREMGFTEGLQYQYRIKQKLCDMQKREDFFLLVSKDDVQLKQHYQDTVRNSAVNSRFEQKNKFGLQMFYTGDLSNVYYAEDIDCFAVMEMEENILMLQSIICKKNIPLKEVIQRIDVECDAIVLGFTPCREDSLLCEMIPFDGGDDYRFFYRGKDLEAVQKEKLYFPQLSHA